MTSSQESESIRRYLYLFAFTLFIQAVHMVEHFAQVLQAFVFNITPAHGLIGQLDLEQVHFAFNILYFAALIYVLMQWLNFGEYFSKNKMMFTIILVVGVVVQGYHSIEHTIKLLQFISTGMQGTPGIAGMFFNGVWFHFIMNSLVFSPPVIVFFCAGLHKRIFEGRTPSLITS